MTVMRNIKMRGKLFLAFFLLLAITVFITIFGALGMRQIDRQYTYALLFPFERYSTLSSLSLSVMDARRTMNRAAMYINDPGNAIAGINIQEETFSRIWNEVDMLIAIYRLNLDEDVNLPEERKLLLYDAMTAFEIEINHYFDNYVSELMEAARAGNAAEAMRLEVEGISTINQALVHFDFMSNFARDYMEEIRETLSAYTDRSFVTLLVIAAAAIILGLVVSQVISLSITKPMGLLVKTFTDVSRGDLTKRLPDHGKDEIAIASRSFNYTMDEFSRLIVSIKNQSTVLVDIGNDLAINMTETASAMNEIAANIQSIKGRIENQSASVTETNSTMEQVAANIGKLSGHVEDQSAAVTESSSALQEMIANIQSVTSTLTKNAANVKELQDSSNTGRNSLQDVADDIQEIARQSEGLFEINSVMENIASQTNLLSMNAAIEAAHAGDAGKGFAVVADEIRKLAESSSEQSKTIGDVLKKIKESIDKITLSTNNVMSRFEVIDQGVKTVAEQEENIRNAMDEQTQGSKQILKSASFVSDITQQVRTGSVEMLEGSREVIHESQNLEKATQEITSGMNEMAAGAEQVNRAVASVNDLTGKTKENISSLVQAVSRFKV